LIKVFEMDRKFESLTVVGNFDAADFRLYGSFLRDITRGLMYYAHLGGLQVIHEENMQILTKFKCLGDMRSMSLDKDNTKLYILS